MLNQRGNTLLEILLVVALFAILVAASAPWSIRSNHTNDLALAASTIVSVVRRAGASARASDGDSAWGIKISAGELVLFKGNSFSTRVSGFDDTFSLPAAVTITGDSEIVWAKFTGTPSVNPATIVLSISTGEQKTITINSLGMPSY